MHFITQSVLLRALGWSLINSFWQMALVWLAYTIVTGAGSRFSSAARHRLALLSVIFGSCWFLFSLVSNVLAENEIHVSNSYSEIALADYKNLTGIFYFINDFIRVNLPFLSLAYLIMLILLSARYINYFRHSQELKLSGLHKIDPEFRLFTASVARHLGIRKKVQVWLSSVVESPMVVGFFKPIILIPIATINHLTAQQVESILLHELAHIKRDDYLLNLLVTINGIILFFNPFTRLLISNINTEREHSCDDMVLQFRYDPCLYASALLSLEKTRNQYHKLVISAIGKSNHLLLERVRRVIGNKNFTGNYRSRLIGNLLLTIMTALILLLQPHEIASGLPDPLKTKINPNPETQPKIFVFDALPAKVKNKKASKPKNNLAFLRPDANDIVLVSNEESEDLNDQENILPAIQVEPKEYSIAPSLPGPALSPGDEPNNFPYVPNSSYSFKVTEDTSSARNLEITSSYTVRLANGSLEKALKACNEVYWKKMEKSVPNPSKKINLEKLEQEIRKTLMLANWGKIDQDACNSLSEADNTRIRQNIQLELQGLQNNKTKNKLQRSLKTRIVEDELELQQQYLKRQEGNFNKKRYKIVYI
jgi:beta-lactamase regulating signal transducer with metallopeptidase domain